jgi:hypothetical protein
VVYGHKKKIAQIPNLKMIRLQGRLTAGGDAEEGHGPQRDDYMMHSEERGTSHMDQSVFATM